MLQIFQTKLNGFLNNIGKEKALFLEPTCIDFSKLHTAEFISSLNTIIKNTGFEKIKDIIGSSAGAIIALLLGLGYTFAEIVLKLNDVHFHQLLNNKSNLYRIPLSLIVSNKTQNNQAILDRQVECLQEDNFLIWATQQIQDKLGSPWATFSDLHKQATQDPSLKDIHLIGLDLNTGKLVLLNYKNTSDLPIAIAVRICMSFSTTFSIVEIKNLSTGEDSAYADGGITLQHINFDGCGYIKFHH